MPVPHHGIDVLAEKKSKVGPIVGIVAFILVGGGLLLYLNRAGSEAALEKAFQSPDVASYTSKAGQTAKTHFEDSTALNLGADTKLVVPPGYAQRWRAVQLDGTVELTPPPNADPPLDIRASRNVSVVSSGGTVGVHSFTTDSWTAVRVKGGSADVKAPGGTRTITDGQGVIVDSTGTVRDATPTEIGDAFSWVDGNLTITNQPLGEAIKRIRRWYNMELNVKDKALLERPVTLSATITESGQMVDALQAAAKVKFGYDGGRMILTDASGK
jgi:ferric-dicitrate binding protein FerR (iron transport regulator)